MTMTEWAMTTSSDLVTENDLYEFLYCPQGYYLTYLIENGLPPANGLAPELLETLGRYYREYVRFFGERPMGVFVSEDILRKPDKETYLKLYVDSLKPSDSVNKPYSPRTLKLTGWEKAMLMNADGLATVQNQVRRVRQNGLPARICGTKKCICGCLADELGRIALEHKHISIVNGVGAKAQVALEDMGIVSCEHILQTPTESIVAALKERALPASHLALEKIKLGARSYVENRVIVAGGIPPVGSSYIVLDCEFMPVRTTNVLYLIGVAVVIGDERDYHFFWANSENEEKTTIKRLTDLLSNFKKLPVVTWDGEKHDLLKLQREAERLKVKSPTNAIAHIRDLFKECDDAVRFPSRRFRLEDLAMWLGFPGERIARYVKRHRNNPKGEDHAWKAHDEYVRCKTLMALSDDHKRELIQCNRDDLDMLIWVSEKLPRLKAESANPRGSKQ